MSYSLLVVVQSSPAQFCMERCLTYIHSGRIVAGLHVLGRAMRISTVREKHVLADIENGSKLGARVQPCIKLHQDPISVMAVNSSTIIASERRNCTCRNLCDVQPRSGLSLSSQESARIKKATSARAP
jgi:hypothetical protein